LKYPLGLPRRLENVLFGVGPATVLVFVLLTATLLRPATGELAATNGASPRTLEEIYAFKTDLLPATESYNGTVSVDEPLYNFKVPTYLP
jgi:hypothetical protein